MHHPLLNTAPLPSMANLSLREQRERWLVISVTFPCESGSVTGPVLACCSKELPQASSYLLPSLAPSIHLPQLSKARLSDAMSRTHARLPAPHLWGWHSCLSSISQRATVGTKYKLTPGCNRLTPGVSQSNLSVAMSSQGKQQGE